MSDAIQFLMERDRASSKNRRKPAKNALFCDDVQNPSQNAARVATQKS
jgi:hypothetical protein